MVATQIRARRKNRLDPELVELPSRTMAVVHTVGAPDEAGAKAIPALYGAVYAYKFACKRTGHDFTVEPLRARWWGIVADPTEGLVADRSTWKAAWAIPLPDGTASLPRRTPDIEVTIETWNYGTVAQILHEGSYASETSTIKRLQSFIAEQGYEIAGPHEEVYLTRPTAKVPKTMIRYAVASIQT